MTQQELEARAAQRAKDRHIHVMAVPGRPGVFQVSSLSEPGTKQTLVAADGIIACSCKSYYYRKMCCHVAALEARRAREAVAAERRARQQAALRVAA